MNVCHGHRCSFRSPLGLPVQCLWFRLRSLTNLLVNFVDIGNMSSPQSCQEYLHGSSIPNPNSMHLEVSQCWKNPVFDQSADFPDYLHVPFMCHHLWLLT